jgi:hypothetical protein
MSYSTRPRMDRNYHDSIITGPPLAPLYRPPIRKRAVPARTARSTDSHLNIKETNSKAEGI